MSKTKIPWSEYSWNPIRYLNGWMCTKVSPGCLHCYAEAMNLRFGNGGYYRPDEIQEDFFRLDERILNQPLHWRNPRRVFVQSMGDLFHEQIPFDFVDKILAVIYLTPSHTYQMLTKRPVRMAEYFLSRYPMDDSCRIDTLPQWYQAAQEIIDEARGVQFDQLHKAAENTDPRKPLPNLWLGVTVENEKYLSRLNELIHNVPAAVKFVSLEPLLEEIHIADYLKYLDRFWVICGPETGPKRRPCEIEWLESIVDQCDAARVPVFVKAVPMNGRISDDPAEWPKWARRREYPK